MFKKLLNLLSDAAVYGISSMLTRLVGLVLMLVGIRYLSKDEYGIVIMLAVVSTIFLPISNLGMTNAVFRRFNFEKDEKARATALTTGLVSVTCSSLILLAILVVFAGPLTQVLIGDVTATPFMRVTLLNAAVTSIGMVPFVALRAARRVKTAAAINVGKVLVSLGVTLWLLVVMEKGIWALVIGPLVGESVLTLVQLVLTFRAFWSTASLDAWKRMLAYGLPFVPHHVQAVGLDLFSVYLVRELEGLGIAGVYGVATRLASPASFIVNSIQASWVPYKFQMHAEETNSKEFFQSTFTYYVAGLTYLWVGVSLWGPEMVWLMTTPQFYGAANLMWAVALVPICQGLYFMAGTGIELSDNTRPLPLVSFAGLCTVVALALILIPRIEAYGAALATACGWLVMASAIYALSQRRFSLSYDWPTIGMFVALAIAFVVAGQFAMTLPAGSRLTVAILFSVVYPMLGILLLLRSRDERGRMLHLLGKFKLS